jgi:hypothetical protein
MVFMREGKVRGEVELIYGDYYTLRISRPTALDSSSVIAILPGWASDLPVLVKIYSLPEDQRPKSADPDFWDVWSGKSKDGRAVERVVDWKAITDGWQQIALSTLSAREDDSGTVH